MPKPTLAPVPESEWVDPTPPRQWQERAIGLRASELWALAGALANVENAAEALTYDEPFCQEARRFAAIVRDRRNEREAEIRRLQLEAANP